VSSLANPRNAYHGVAYRLGVPSLRILDERSERTPVIGDVTNLVRNREPRLAALAIDRDDVNRYHERVQSLVDGLTALGPNGPFGDMFARETTEHIEVGRPMVFDVSTIDEADHQMHAAVQTVCWNYGSAVVSADKHLAEAGLKEQRHYFLVMDELWRMLRASDVMVYFLDSLTRLNRQRGIGQVMITHTMNDLELSSEHLSKIASGFVERSTPRPQGDDPCPNYSHSTRSALCCKSSSSTSCWPATMPW
jgi:hypothetical protein